MNDINSKEEFLWLYNLQKERVKKLREAELESGGTPFPDTTQNIDLLLKILIQMVDRSIEEYEGNIERHYTRLLEDLEIREDSSKEQSTKNKNFELLSGVEENE